MNKEEISGVPDVFLPAAKKKLNKSKKRLLSNAIKDVSLMDLVY